MRNFSGKVSESFSYVNKGLHTNQMFTCTQVTFGWVKTTSTEEQTTTNKQPQQTTIKTSRQNHKQQTTKPFRKSSRKPNRRTCSTRTKNKSKNTNKRKKEKKYIIYNITTSDFFGGPVCIQNIFKVIIYIS